MPNDVLTQLLGASDEFDAVSQHLYTWLRATENEKRLKFTDYTYDLENGYKVVDVRLARALDQDLCYAQDPVLRRMLRRGCGLLTRCDLKDGAIAYLILRQGLPKFFDFVPANTSRQLGVVDRCCRELFERDLEKLRNMHENEACVQIRTTEKLNGENAQISFCAEIDVWVCCSKNVTLLSDEYGSIIDHHIETKMDSQQRTRIIVRPSSRRYETALRVLVAWLAMLHCLKNSEVLKLKSMLSRGTLIGELSSITGNNARVLNPSASQAPSMRHHRQFFLERFGTSLSSEVQSLLDGLITFFAFVDHASLEDRLAVPLTSDHDITQFLVANQLPVVPFLKEFNFDVFDFDKLESSLSSIADQIFVRDGIEGAVLYISLVVGKIRSCFEIWKVKSFRYLGVRRIRERLKSIPKKMSSMIQFWNADAFVKQEVSGLETDLQSFINSHPHAQKISDAVITELTEKFRTLVLSLVETCGRKKDFLASSDNVNLLVHLIDSKFQQFLQDPGLFTPKVNDLFSDKKSKKTGDALTQGWESLQTEGKRLHLVSPTISGLNIRSLKIIGQGCQLDILKGLVTIKEFRFIPSLGARFKRGRRSSRCDHRFTLNSNPFIVEKCLMSIHNKEGLDSIPLWKSSEPNPAVPIDRVIIIDFDLDPVSNPRITSPLMEFESSLDSSLDDGWLGDPAEDLYRQESRLIGTLEQECKRRKLDSSSSLGVPGSYSGSSLLLSETSTEETGSNRDTGPFGLDGDIDSSVSDEDERQRCQWALRLREIKEKIAARVMISNDDVCITRSICEAGCCSLFGVERRKPNIKFESLIEVCYQSHWNNLPAARDSTIQSEGVVSDEASRGKAKIILLMTLGFPGSGKSTILSRFCDAEIAQMDPENKTVDGCYLSLEGAEIPIKFQIADARSSHDQLRQLRTVSDAHSAVNFWSVSASTFVAFIPSDDLIRQNLTALGVGVECDPAYFRKASKHARMHMDRAIDRSVEKALSSNFKRIFILIDKNQVPDSLNGQIRKFLFLMERLQNDRSMPAFVHSSLLITTAFDVCSSFPVCLNKTCPSCAFLYTNGSQSETGHRCNGPIKTSQRRTLASLPIKADDVLNFEKEEEKFQESLEDAITYSNGSWELPWSVSSLVECALRCFDRRDHSTLQTEKVLNIMLSFVMQNRRSHLHEFKRGNLDDTSEASRVYSDIEHVLELPMLKSTWAAAVNQTPDNSLRRKFLAQHRYLQQMLRRAVLRPFQPFAANYHNEPLYRSCETVILACLAAIKAEKAIREYRKQDLSESIGECLSTLQNRIKQIESGLQLKIIEKSASSDAALTTSSVPSPQKDGHPADDKQPRQLSPSPVYIGIRLDSALQDYWNSTGLRWIKSVLHQSVIHTWNDNPRLKGLTSYIDSVPRRCLPRLHITTRYFGHCRTVGEIRLRQEILKSASFAFNQPYVFDLTHIVVCPAGLVAAAVRPTVALGYTAGTLPWYFEDSRSSIYPHVTLACDKSAGFTPADSNNLLSGVNEQLLRSQHRHPICCITASSAFALLSDPNIAATMKSPNGLSPRSLVVGSHDTAVVSHVTFLPIVSNRFANVFVIHIREKKLSMRGRYEAFYPLEN
eukprot:Gregarina_sp_Poly_1__4007@NODE_220_length_11254_cov_142_067489_g194_i0_p1_GENE_NODE_220_length_11254_cov_142_067489_g194_i0NODE_220_length_11254_cov_142_067489_g194_i0_p1_ORF_typecomplete_len1598_score207_99NACHT/PF05729_12/0_017NACHT/PF05729_12/1_8e03Septin/PF00735_18/2_7Septin/PF00735_18/3RNA_ligase/PF09414_10/0_016Zeta_toxin/PF06414_12/3_6e03Zeta_toxin/PF06414_12/0_044MMR_HSR1/PF01926_23/3_8e02MMR_HSR1/PF01926_23/0_27AAA_22/PF13401_6/2_3e03AAA_22/PF13401_6/0_54AAA_22/PF13401_6/1_2e04HAP/PF038